MAEGQRRKRQSIGLDANQRTGLIIKVAVAKLDQHYPLSQFTPHAATRLSSITLPQFLHRTTTELGRPAPSYRPFTSIGPREPETEGFG